MKRIAIVSFAALSLLPVAAFADKKPDYRAEAIAMLKRDFEPRGIASLDRLDEDELQATCNRTSNKPNKKTAAKLEKSQLAAVEYPADGVLMGDWRRGEQIAQNGRGFTWTDKPGVPGGGNCYNCHEISPKEAAHGTLGPSLLHFGKVRGNTPEMQKYVYTKIFNSKSYVACSIMPRFGRVGALTPEQIKDIVALLLDPESPVNQ